MTCPDASDLAALFEDATSASLRATIEQHLDGCDDCRLTVAALARSRVSRPVDAAAATGVAATEVGLTAPPSPRADLAPGTRVGRYVIRAVLGRGGMGVVYLADDPELSREVAIKVVRPDLARAQPALRQLIVHEAKAMAQLSHPNVIAVHDAGTEGDIVFIAMERVRGTDLRVWLAAERRTVGEILDAFIAAGRGLAAAHAAAMVHRDFKPDNVLVGGDGRVRVTDFGLAQGIAGDDGLEGAAVGTPAYMSPEQHAGQRADPRSDQFSFCVALWEALHGQRPFAGGTRAELAEAIRAGRITPPPATSRVPSSLRAVLVRGMAASPAARFPGLDDLLRALGRNRARTARGLAIAAGVGLIVAGLGFVSDDMARGRAEAATRTAFETASGQVGGLLSRRIQRFDALVDSAHEVPVLRQVTAHIDQADFGLGSRDADAERRADLHAALVSADWLESTEAGPGNVLAIADSKGRLLYTTADPARAGDDARRLPMLDHIYRRVISAPQLAVVRGDDPALVASGIGGGARDGLQVVFARALIIGDQPKASIIEIFPGARLLADVTPGPGTVVSLVAPGGVAEGSVPDAVVRRAMTGEPAVRDIRVGAGRWFVRRHAVTNPGEAMPVAAIVAARRVDPASGGLFPHARQVFVVLAGALALLAIGAMIIARRLDLYAMRT